MEFFSVFIFVREMKKLLSIFMVTVLLMVVILSNIVVNAVVIPKISYARLVSYDDSRKDGVIGTNGRGVVALRFDDYQDAFGAKIYPLLIERGLPCSMALISRFNTEQPWGKGTTWSQVRDWNRNGVEMWSHGTDHKDYSKKGYEGLYSQIVTSKLEIEKQNIKVVGWVLPGVAPAPNKLPLYNGLTKPSDYDSTVGRLLMQTYSLTEAYAYYGPRILPTHVFHGLNHYTVSDGGMTLASAIATIDVAIENKVGIEIMCHPGNLDKPGKMTLSDFTILLDYIKTQWDNCSIEVLTPSGLFFADPNSSTRFELTANDSFEGAGSWTGKTIETSGGKTGDNFLRIGNSISNSPVTQKIDTSDKSRISGEQFVFEGWVRASGNGITTGGVKINELNINKVITTVSFWTRVRFVFCVPQNTKIITLSLYRSSGDSIYWDDVSIKKI